MTAQVPDTMIYKKRKYDLIGVQGTILPSPLPKGIEPMGCISCCWRGYANTYAIVRKELMLKRVEIAMTNELFQFINGFGPEEYTSKGFAGLKVSFTGKLRIARDFMGEFYVHMGFQKASAFLTVLDLTLDTGRVTEVLDRSEEVAEMRGHYQDRYQSMSVFERIDESFSRDMDLE